MGDYGRQTIERIARVCGRKPLAAKPRVVLPTGQFAIHYHRIGYNAKQKLLRSGKITPEQAAKPIYREVKVPIKIELHEGAKFDPRSPALPTGAVVVDENGKLLTTEPAVRENT